MKRTFLFITALAVALCFGTPAVFAQHGGGHAGGPPSGAGGGHTSMGGPGMGGPGMGGTGSTMGRGSDMGGMHRNGTEMGPNMGSQRISHSSPTSLLSSNPKLNTTLQQRLGTLLPAGTSLTDAASGFKNLGQFIAAVHVSHNLGIPFEDLKAKMTSGDSLGKAIKELKPDAHHKSEAKKAKKQAKEDLKEVKS